MADDELTERQVKSHLQMHRQKLKGVRRNKAEERKRRKEGGGKG
jgi:hypothetical protein